MEIQEVSVMDWTDWLRIAGLAALLLWIGSVLWDYATYDDK